MDEKESRCNPEGEGKWRTEFGEHAILDDVLAERGNVFDGAVAALASAVGRCEDGGAGRGVGG